MPVDFLKKTHWILRLLELDDSPGDSSRDLFGMVSSRDPFKGLLVTSNVWGWKGHGLNQLGDDVLFLLLSVFLSFLGGFQSFWESFCTKQNLGKTGNCTNQNDTWNHKDHKKLEVSVSLYSQWLVGGFSPTHLNISKWVHLPQEVKTNIWNHLDPKSSMEYLPTP